MLSSDYVLRNVPGTLVSGLFSHMALCVFISTLDPLDMRTLAVGFLAKAEDSMRKNTGSDLLGMRAGVVHSPQSRSPPGALTAPVWIAPSSASGELWRGAENAG